MTITTSGVTVTTNGNIKSIEDFQAIKRAVEGIIANSKSVHLELIDTISLTSSVIGYLTKIVHKDGIALSITLTDRRLYELLNDLNLVKSFNVQKS